MVDRFPILQTVVDRLTTMWRDCQKSNLLEKQLSRRRSQSKQVYHKKICKQRQNRRNVKAAPALKMVLITSGRDKERV